MVQRINKATPAEKPRGPYKVKDERITLAADSLSRDRPNGRREMEAKDAMRAASSTEAECNDRKTQLRVGDQLRRLRKAHPEDSKIASNIAIKPQSSTSPLAMTGLPPQEQSAAAGLAKSISPMGPLGQKRGLRHRSNSTQAIQKKYAEGHHLDIGGLDPSVCQPRPCASSHTHKETRDPHRQRFQELEG